MLANAAFGLACMLNGASAMDPSRMQSSTNTELGYAESWSYTEVRQGAHLFSWLYQNTSLPTDAPLIIWSNGGPGASSIGYGDYSEMGPIDTNLQPRASTWLSQGDLLFVDGPVGTGWSYVDNMNLLTTNVTQIANDLVTYFQTFTKTFPEYQTRPVYFVAESYGGKMLSAAAQAVLAAVDNGSLKMNLKSLSLGDSWIDGLSYVQAWGPWLRELSVLDANQLATQVQPDVDSCTAAVKAGDWVSATNFWGSVENDITSTTDDISFYNILQHNVADDDDASTSASPKPLFKRMLVEADVPAHLKLNAEALALLPPKADHHALNTLYRRHVGYALGEDLNNLMNGPIRQKLGSVIPQNVTWGGQSGAVFSAQSGDFMTPVVDIVDDLLKDGRLAITVYNGQLDLICCTSGTEAWMNTLTWDGLQSFLTSPKTALYTTAGGQNTAAFVKEYENLSMYYIMAAGHMIPQDQPDAALLMIQSIIANVNKNGGAKLS